MRKTLIILIISIAAAIKTAGVAAAKEEEKFIQKKLILMSYLRNKKSPLEEYAENLILSAENNNLDWRLIPAITGVESSFGKRIPYNSYNAYGWANGEYKFSSWKESIETVSQALNKKYIQKGAVSINKIARIYAPPSTTWASNIKFFVNQIDPIGLPYEL